MIRSALALAGVAAIGWGLWLVRDDGVERWRSQAAWFLGGVLAHDAVLAPLMVFLGVLATRLLRPALRRVAAVAFIVWATVTVAVTNVLLPVGGRPDNASLMNRPYVWAWVGFTGAMVVFVAVAALRGRAKAAQPQLLPTDREFLQGH